MSLSLNLVQLVEVLHATAGGGGGGGRHTVNGTDEAHAGGKWRESARRCGVMQRDAVGRGGRAAGLLTLEFGL